VDIVELAIRYMDKARDIAAQVEQGVHLYCRAWLCGNAPTEKLQGKDRWSWNRVHRQCWRGRAPKSSPLYSLRAWAISR